MKEGPITNKNCDTRYSDRPSTHIVNFLAVILLNGLENNKNKLKIFPATLLEC
jgi:hypothetical protein